MLLSKYQVDGENRWAVDGQFLPASACLENILELPAAHVKEILALMGKGKTAGHPVLAPIDQNQEVWASGVTYLRSREARKAESASADIYQKVYDAQRPELFYKSHGWRVIGNGMGIRIRKDSRWNVPEPELVLVINKFGEIVGYSAGNDVSSRDIEGENPLYLPQAKVYNGSCALGPAICLIDSEADLDNLPIQLDIVRSGTSVFHGETSTAAMKRKFAELVEYLFLELDFPLGVLLMTGTGIVPDEKFSLLPGDEVRIQVGELLLVNPVK
jgi:2-dehydro-3-deoxy-D-arabinonate dehydratase